MSLILEALKKSEAERRLGQMPGLMTPVQRVTPQRASKLPLLLAAVVIIGGVGAAGWWWSQRVPAEAHARVDASARVDVPVAAPVQAPASVPAPASTPATPAPIARTQAADAPELPSDPDFASTERESRPMRAQAAPPPEPMAARFPPVAPPAPTAVAEPAATRDPATGIVDMPARDSGIVDAPALPQPVPVTVPPPAPAAPAEPVELLPRLVDLPASERDALPPLKLTMHVYAAEPAARFAIIDGRRLGEGDRIAPSLTITDIRRDGAVLDFNGRRFLLPRL